MNAEAVCAVNKVSGARRANHVDPKKNTKPMPKYLRILQKMIAWRRATGVFEQRATQVQDESSWQLSVMHFVTIQEYLHRVSRGSPRGYAVMTVCKGAVS